MPVSNRLTRLLKEPLIQFLIIGGFIYGAYALFGTPEEDFRDTTIVVDSNANGKPAGIARLPGRKLTA